MSVIGSGYLSLSPRLGLIKLELVLQNKLNTYLLAFACLLFGCIQTSCSEEAPAANIANETPEIDPDTLSNARISFVGDLMCHSPQWNWCRVEDTTFDFTPCFEFVEPALQAADLMVGNLETVCAGPSRPLHGFPRFNAPDEYVRDMGRVGFDVLTTSNNHTIDQGYKGVYRTCDIVTKYGMSYVGSACSPEDRDSVRMYDVNGIKLAMVGYTENTNGLDMPKGKPWVVNILDTTLIRQDIKAAREAGAELVAVYFHFGEEYARVPSQYQRLLVDITKSFGADIIIGGHTHTIMPGEFFETQGGTLDTGFVIYSMGNFFSNQRDRYSDVGLILNLELEKNKKTGRIKLREVSYIPTWIYRGFDPRKKLHVIFPAEMSEYGEIPEYVDAKALAKMKQGFNDTKNHIIKYSEKIRLLPLAEWRDSASVSE